MVAANRVDLLATMRWGYEWDIAAATLIAREAGAAVSDIFGQPLGYNKRDPRSFGLLVCAPGIQQQAIEHFGHTSGWSIEGRRQWLIVHRQGWRCKPKQLRGLLREAWESYRVFMVK